MTVATFTSCDRETVRSWRSPVGRSGDGLLALVPYWSAELVLFVLDRRTGCPWLFFGSDHMALAPAPYLGALSTVLSDLLTEEADR